MKSACMIAGTNSGSGKTTFSMGIMAAMTKRGIRVRGFKTGPDYIDPMFHKKVTNRNSYNLDTWMIEDSYLKYTFRTAMENSDIGIVEGVMGLFDGHGTTSNEGSASHLSEVLNLPIILVVDARGKSRSIAAEILGYMSFEKNTKIAGILLNRISSQKHYEYMKEIIEHYTNLKCYGYLENLSELSLKERHLGLVPVEEDLDFDKKIESLVLSIEKTVDLDSIINDFKMKSESIKVPDKILKLKNKYNGKRIAIAWDEAFNFYYSSNLDLLEYSGVELIKFSPIRDFKLPSDIDGLYLGGGFPEVFASSLEQNFSMRKDIFDQLENGLPTYAECGGFMYLTKSITLLNENKFEMIGFLDTNAYMTKRLQRFGYAFVDINSKYKIKAHEFHHSKVDPEVQNAYYNLYKTKNNEVLRTWQDGWYKKNTLSAYAHLNFLSNIDVLMWLLDQCK